MGILFRKVLLRKVLAAFLLVSCVSAQSAMAQDATPSVLEIYVNGHSRHVVAMVIPKADGLWISAADLATANIATTAGEANADGFVNLTALHGIKVRLINTEQKLEILADDNRLVPQAFDLRPTNQADNPTAALTEAASGFLSKYDIVTTINDLNQAGESTSVAAALGGTLFSPSGNLTTNSFIRSNGEDSSFIRLDTALEYDEPDNMRRFIAGDTISGGPTWARSVRLGGFQMASDFSMRPDLATFPLPAFFGQTAVPATVDVFVNSARVFQTNVDAGPFHINNLPIITGAGSATVVTRDILGRETTATLPFYASSALLREGLSSYSVDAGFIRTNYGKSSFDYDQPAFAGTYARGIQDDLTLEGHTEITENVQLAGAGAAFTISPYGVLHTASAASTNTLDGSRDVGFLHSLSFDSQWEPFSFFGSASFTHGDYADMASVGGTAPPRLQLQAGTGVSMGDAGSLTVSWLNLQNRGQSASQLITGTYSVSLGGNWNFGASTLYDLSNDSYVTEASISFFYDDYVGTASGHTGTNREGQNIGVIKPVNPDGGFGYRLSASRGDNESKQAEATWIGSRGSVNGQLAQTNGIGAARLDFSGGVVAMDGGIYATKTPDSAVALVHTGKADAEIFRENRLVATADEDGDALITSLVPYTANRISIDPRNYKLSTVVETTEQAVVPGRQSGSIIDFTPTKRSPALITLQRDDNSFPPVGSSVMLGDAKEPLVVGHHGEVFIADLAKPVTGTVTYETGSCEVTITPPTESEGDGIPRVGPLRCITGLTP